MGEDVTAISIRRLVSPCPACGKEHLEAGDGHEYAPFASEVAKEPSPALAQFFKLYKEHDWVALNRIQRFDGSANAAEVFVLRCTGGVSMLAIRTPTELYDADSLLDAVALDPTESASVGTLSITFHSI